MDEAARVGLSEAAELLGVHYMTVYHYVRSGRLPAEQHGSIWSVARRDLEEFKKSPTPRARGESRPARPLQLVERMIRGDQEGAWGVIQGALRSGVSPGSVYLDLLGPALRIIGDRWAEGEVSIADEHRASVVAARVIGRLGSLFAQRGRTRGSVLLGAPPEELHVLPVAMVADLVRAAHFEPIDLGANAPVASFVESALSADRLVAVLVGVTTTGLDDSVREVVSALATAVPGVPVFVGGRAVRDEEHARRLGAAGFSGVDGLTAVAAVEGAASVRKG